MALPLKRLLDAMCLELGYEPPVGRTFQSPRCRQSAGSYQKPTNEINKPFSLIYISSRKIDSA